MAFENFTPIDTEAEASVLAQLILNPSVFLDISTNLLPSDFGTPAYRDIYAAIVACDATDQPFDVITIANELKKRKRLAAVGGRAALDKLLDTTTKSANIESHVAIIREKSLLRALLAASADISKSALDPAASPEDVLSMAESTILSLGQERRQSSIAEMAQVMSELLQSLSQRKAQLLSGHSTGFKELDAMTGGLQPGQLIVVGARPGMGKSVLGTQIARHIAQTTGLVVPIFSYEMTRREIGVRLLASYLGFDSKLLEQGDFPPAMERDLSLAAQTLAQVPLLLDDRPPETFAGLRSQARRLARRGPLGAIVVDYIQLMHSERRYKDENRTQEIAEITRGLKLLANELEVPIIAISQLSRGLETRANRRPGLSDLRESGSIEQDANVVIFLYRDSQYSQSADEKAAEIIIAKNRSGPLGTIKVMFEGNKGPRFREYNQDPGMATKQQRPKILDKENPLSSK